MIELGIPANITQLVWRKTGMNEVIALPQDDNIITLLGGATKYEQIKLFFPSSSPLLFKVTINEFKIYFMATKTPKLIPIVQLGNCLRRKGFSLVQLCMSPYVRQLPAAEKQILINAVRNINQLLRRHDRSDSILVESGLLRFGENQYIWQVTDSGSHTEIYPDGSLAEFKHRMLTLLRVMQ